MSVWLLTGAALLLADPLDARFTQAAPEVRAAAPFQKTQKRAVVLVHGLRVHPFSSSSVGKAQEHSWQKPGSVLVDQLAREADVYAFAYGQDAAVETAAAAPELEAGVRRLKALGYDEIALVGHSAGGLIVRAFVEDRPDAGATKVVQVATPNGGARLAAAKILVRSNQEVFLESLTPASREKQLERRKDKKIPRDLDFACVVCHLTLELKAPRTETTVDVDARGDGVVPLGRQWTPDLQEQGIPAVVLASNHQQAMRGQAGADLLARLVRSKQPRWKPDEVQAARKTILGLDDPAP